MKARKKLAGGNVVNVFAKPFDGPDAYASAIGFALRTRQPDDVTVAIARAPENRWRRR